MELKNLLDKLNQYYNLYVIETEAFILEEIASIIRYLKDRINELLDNDIYLLNHLK